MKAVSFAVKTATQQPASVILEMRRRVSGSQRGFACIREHWRAIVFAVFCFFTQISWAAGEAAVVASLTGTVSAQGTDGSMRVLAANSPLWPGDLIQTEKDSGVNIRFTDGGRVALRPNSRFLIEAYRHETLKPEDDSAVFQLVKGGMRTVTGLVGKRGKQDSYQNKTVTAVIGIRGTDYVLLLCAENDPACTSLIIPPSMRSSDGQPPPGLYLSTFEGKINAANNAGDKDFAAGQSGYIRDFDTLPRELEEEPGLLKEFLGFYGMLNFMNPIDASPEACMLK